MMSRRQVWVLSGFIVLLFGGGSLLAHTKLQKSEPAADSTVAPPAHVQLWFNEAPDLKVSKIEITGPAGKLELGPAHLMDAKTVMATIKSDARLATSLVGNMRG
mgnify:CR=1 FL=1